MDQETIDSYDCNAQKIASLHSTIVPNRLYELISNYFVKYRATADIGCGIGRDAYWMTQNNFPTIGLDPSQEMLRQAVTRFPTITFIQDSLPNLDKINSSKFQNILCSAVLMHINKDLLQRSCIRLIQLLDKDGYLIISFRSTNQLGNREQGKLYESIDIEQFISFFTKNNCKILVSETDLEESRQLEWHNFVIRKT